MSFLSKLFSRKQRAFSDDEMTEKLAHVLTTPPDEEALRNAGMSEQMIESSMKYRKIFEESRHIEKKKQTTRN